MHPICAQKIGLQSAKELHAYPIIRPPREFRELVGSDANKKNQGGATFSFALNFDTAMETPPALDTNTLRRDRQAATIRALPH
jgi:hypothetical protein